MKQFVINFPVLRAVLLLAMSVGLSLGGTAAPVVKPRVALAGYSNVTTNAGFLGL